MPIEHSCDLTRGISYYLEPCLILGIYGKTSLTMVLQGNTDTAEDQSLESLKSFFNYALSVFGHPGTLELTVKKRAYAPLGGGEVRVVQRYAKTLKSIAMTDEGKIKRVRGLLTSAKVSPQLTTRVIDKIREIFNDYLPDVWIHADHYKKGQAGD